MGYFLSELQSGLSHLRPFVITTNTHCEVYGQLLRDVDFSVERTRTLLPQMLRLKLRGDAESFVITYIVDDDEKVQRFDFGHSTLELSFMYTENMLCCPTFRIIRYKDADI